MKNSPLMKLIGAFVALMTLASFGQMAVQPANTGQVSLPSIIGKPGLGQILKQKSQDSLARAGEPIPTASEVLANILAETDVTPLGLYPPEYLTKLKVMGNQPMYALSPFDPHASALRAGDKANMKWMDATFFMGAPSGEAEVGGDEQQHSVTITYGFYMAQYPVTQGEYQNIMGVNPSRYQTTDRNGNPISPDLNRPVESVSWQDASTYCSLLTQQELANGHIRSAWAYRLPTEAEWEYSCRAGTTTAFNFGHAIQGGMANFDNHYEYDDRAGTTTITTPTVPTLYYPITVGSYQASPFGLYDMHGNINELCQDWYDGGYSSASVIDPQGPTSGTERVYRGGSFFNPGRQCRSDERGRISPTSANEIIGFRIVLAPVVPEWKTAVATLPSAKTYGIPPTKTTNGLVLITHGWTKVAPDQSWIETMSNSITTYLTGAGVTDWQVYGYHWEGNSSTLSPSGALNNGVQEGINLGNSIVNQGWTKVHLIAHSAGAPVIQVATEIIKGRAPSTIVQCTFLDPFVGFDYAGVTTYGNGADWSDRYSSHGDIEVGGGKFTDQPLYSAYNVDITALDPSIGNSGFFTGLSGYATCSLFAASHGWAVQFYQNSITGNITPDYDGFGFLLSKESGGWPNAPTQHPVGNINSVRVLGTQPQSCSLLGALVASAGILIDFTASPKAGQSTSGTITTTGGKLVLITGSPVWLSIVPTNTDPVNLLSFDANFTSTGVGAAGLLSVLWDSDTIGTLDERTIGQGVAHYALRFPVTESNSTHVLSFRLDPFTNVQSTIVITNVMLSEQGVVQPFALSTTTNTVNGLPVWQLTGQSGFDYGLQASTNLIDWTQIAVLENTNGVVNFSDQSSTNYPMRFYRAVAPY